MTACQRKGTTMTRASPKLRTTAKPLTDKQRKWRQLLEKLEQRCLQPIDEFRALGTVLETKDGPLIHIDRGSPIIGVAHMDTVATSLPDRVKWYNSLYANGLPTIQSIQLDDRLGVWMLLDLLPAMGMEFDVLLCDGEESGRSTAAHFKPTREYNWGFEFDRAGIDTVLYDYEDDKTWKNALEDAGFDIQLGSFSDICSLGHVGCCFANFGCGYRHQHSTDCYAQLDDTVLMALEFETWYKAQKDTAYKYTPFERSQRWSRRRSPMFSQDFDWHYGYDDGWVRKNGKWVKSYTRHTNRTDNQVRCPWCNATDWDEEGVCIVCGHDPIMDGSNPAWRDEQDMDQDCPWCGRQQWIEEDGHLTCEFCGYAGALR